MKRIKRPRECPTKTLRVQWLGKIWFIELFQSHGTNFYWIWLDHNDCKELRAVIPFMHGKPIFSAAQLMYAALVGKLRNKFQRVEALAITGDARDKA